MQNTRMRRFYRLLVLALLLAAPLLQLRCAMACALPEASASVGGCEHERAAAPEGVPTLASHHDCGEHATPAAVVVTNRPLNLDAVPATPVPLTGALTTKLAVAALPVAAHPGGPPGALVVPLRV